MSAMTNDWTPRPRLMTVNARRCAHWLSSSLPSPGDGSVPGEGGSYSAGLTRMVKRRRSRSSAPGPGLKSVSAAFMSEERRSAVFGFPRFLPFFKSLSSRRLRVFDLERDCWPQTPTAHAAAG